MAAAFALLPAPAPPTEQLLPRQQADTGGSATRAPFRPDRSTDRAVARAAGLLRTRQQAALSVASSLALHDSVGALAAGAGAGAGSAAPAGSGALPPRAPTQPGHRRHLRQASGGSAGARLGRTLSAVKGSLATGASWLLNTPDPGAWAWEADPVAAVCVPWLHSCGGRCSDMVPRAARGWAPFGRLLRTCMRPHVPTTCRLHPLPTGWPEPA